MLRIYKGVFKRYTYGIFAMLLLLSSCVSHKQLRMLVEGESETQFTLNEGEPYTIQAGDILDISVKGPSPSQVEIFSRELNQNISGQSSPSAMFLRGYQVDKDGQVEIPLVGKVPVKGYTLNQTRDTLESRIKSYLNFTMITVKLLNFRVTILGEVKNPGEHIVYFSDATIFQALGNAGDFTDLANRKRIKLIRHNLDKKTVKVHYLNLSDNSLLGSELYYMQPNDVLYIEPLKQKIVKVNSPTITLAVSLTTLLLLIYNISTR